MHAETTYQLPKTITVTEGVIEIPLRIYLNKPSDITKISREMTHLLSLLDEDDFDEAFEAEDPRVCRGDHSLYIHTENLPALKYAADHYFLDACGTACESFGKVLASQGKPFDYEYLTDAVADADYDSRVLTNGELVMVRTRF